MYYWTCSRCGANLDPGERCDCEENKNTPERLPNTTGVRGHEYPLNSFYCIKSKGGLSTWQE